MTDGRLTDSLAIFHIHKPKDVGIDDVITELARLKGRRLAFCLGTYLLLLPLSYPIFCFRLPKTLEMGRVNN